MNTASLIVRQSTTFSTTRSTTTNDSIGVPARTFTTNLTGINGFLQDIRGSEAIKYGRPSGTELAAIYCAGSTDVLRKDRISMNGRTFEVIDIDTRASAGSDVYMRIICEERLP